MKLPALILAFALASACVFAAPKPNILFIAMDDQNDWIGHLGGHPLEGVFGVLDRRCNVESRLEQFAELSAVEQTGAVRFLVVRR